MPDLSASNFLNPESIAVIGASRDENKIGHVILANIQNGAYKGRLFPVNPNADKVAGLTCYKSVMDIPEIPDLAIIVIPSAFVLEVLHDCGVKGVKNVIIITAGFGEVSNEGYLQEMKVREVADKYRMRLLGPNCLGMINSGIALNATFASSTPQNGSVAFASQSGAMGTAFLDWAGVYKIGLKYFVSLGNKAGLDENYFLEKFAADRFVKTMLFYLEDFTNGREFYNLARKFSKDKTIIVLKPGESEQAKSAMTSHTGAIAQDDKIVEAALKEAGCIRVHTLEELFNLTLLLSWQNLPKANRVAVITNAGGVGIQTVDDLERNGLKVVPFSEAITTRLKKNLPEEASVANPIDLLGDALAERYKNALNAVVKDKNIDAVLLVLTPQMVTEATLTARYINSIADKQQKTILASFVGGESIREAEELLIKEKIPFFKFPNDAARALGLITDWVMYTKQMRSEKPMLGKPTYINKQIRKHLSTNGVVKLEADQQLAKQYQLPLLSSIITYTQKELLSAVKQIEYPCVLKLVHPELIHKTEFNAVRLNIKHEEELLKSFQELTQIAARSKLVNSGYEIQPFIEEKIEVIIGIKKELPTYRNINGKQYLKTKGFGHVILFGAGGIYTEIYKDFSLRLLPTDTSEALDMIEQTKVGKIISGVRGKSFDKQGIVDVLSNLSKLVESNNNITAIDINPLFVTKEKVYIADLKLFAE